MLYFAQNFYFILCLFKKASNKYQLLLSFLEESENTYKIIPSARCGNKIKNCSGFSKADHFLKIWSLLSPKIMFSSKLAELKNCIVQTPTAPLNFLQEVPREFGPWDFLVPPILVKLVFLDSVRTKFSESDQLSRIQNNFQF